MPDEPTLPPSWRSLDFEWLWVYRSAKQFSADWSPVFHVPPGIFFVEKGRGRMECEEAVQEVPRDHAFFSAPGPRRHWFARGTELLSAGFRVHWRDGSPLFRPGLNRVVPTRDLKPLFDATVALHQNIQACGNTVRPGATAMQSLLHHSTREAAFRTWFAVYLESISILGVATAQERVIGDPRVQEIVTRLDSWPLGKQLDRVQLIAGLPLSIRRLEQLFAEELATPPAAYFERRRADAAREQLCNTKLSLKEISHALGFRHASHFTQWFRRHTGRSPSNYRIQYRESLA